MLGLTSLAHNYQPGHVLDMLDTQRRTSIQTLEPMSFSELPSYAPVIKLAVEKVNAKMRESMAKREKDGVPGTATQDDDYMEHRARKKSVSVSMAVARVAAATEMVFVARALAQSGKPAESQAILKAACGIIKQVAEFPHQVYSSNAVQQALSLTPDEVRSVSQRMDLKDVAQDVLTENDPDQPSSAHTPRDCQ